MIFQMFELSLNLINIIDQLFIGRQQQLQQNEKITIEQTKRYQVNLNKKQLQSDQQIQLQIKTDSQNNILNQRNHKIQKQIYQSELIAANMKYSQHAETIVKLKQENDFLKQKIKELQTQNLMDKKDQLIKYEETILEYQFKSIDKNQYLWKIEQIYNKYDCGEQNKVKMITHEFFKQLINMELNEISYHCEQLIINLLEYEKQLKNQVMQDIVRDFIMKTQDLIRDTSEQQDNTN